MDSPRKTLSEIQLKLSIASSIVVPVLVAVIGWSLHVKLSAQQSSREYVSIASNILMSSETESNEELREWAVQVLNKNSPIPFPEEIYRNLVIGDITLRPPIPSDILDEEWLMAEPEKWEGLEEGATWGDLAQSYLRNSHNFKINLLQIEALQNTIRIFSTDPDEPDFWDQLRMTEEEVNDVPN